MRGSVHPARSARRPVSLNQLVSLTATGARQQCLVVLRSRVFLGGQAVSMLGDGLALLAIPLLVLQLTRSPVAGVLASLPGSVGYLAAGLPAGVLVDRLDPWRVLIAGDVIRALIFLALFLLTWSPTVAAWQILSLAF